MKIALFYFSGTGITRWAVEVFTKIMEDRGEEVALFSIDRKETWGEPFIRSALKDVSLVGIAHPIYGADMPPFMRQFISTLGVIWSQSEKRDMLKAFTICTVMAVNGFGPILEGRLLKKAGLRLAAAVNIRISNNTSVPGFKSNPETEKVIEVRQTKALKQLKELADHLLAGKRYVTGFGLYLLAGYTIRRFFAPKIKENYRSFSVDMTLCAKCFLCVNDCPSRSIQFTGRAFQFKDTCTSCMRCYNYCPACAIYFNGHYADPRVYIRFHGLD